jgi:hypothetical protein
MAERERLTRFILAVASTLAFASAHPVGLGRTPGALEAQTRPVSPSVLATIASRDRNLELLVLWRGSPGWFSAGTHRQANYSEQEGVLTAILAYGTVDLKLSYDPRSHTAQVQDKAVSLSSANVILVDNIDTAGGAVVSKVVTIDSRVDRANIQLSDLLGRSPEVVSFLRCEVGTPNERATQMMRRLACDDLKHP